MRMVPPFPYDTRSQAEKRVFDRLRGALDDSHVAYHSLKPTRHPYKRFPEIDFVICSEEGLYVIEIKGGRVSCQDGVWRFLDRHGHAAESIEGPFRQAETALWGLMEEIRSRLPDDVCDQFTTGYGVVFPDCEWRGEGVEWDNAIVADVRSSRDMDGWLRCLFDYWQGRSGATRHPNAEALERLQNYLRPNTTPAEHALVHQVEDSRQRIERLTEDQMRMVDVAESNPRVLCYGGAGTGKTFLAERLARRWSDVGMQVALVCRSPWLKHFLAARLAVPRVTVSLIEGVRLACRRAGLTRFDAVIVDEGQDLLDMQSIEALDEVLDDGLRAGRWCWFQDLNQSFFPARDLHAKDFLLATKPTQMPLRTNCRNTRIILEWVQEALRADLGVKGAGAGPEVRQRTATDTRQSAEMIASEIVQLVDQGDLTPGSVTVLSPFKFAESSAAAMTADAASRIRPLDEYSMRAMPGDKVGFARIDEFKGLENDAVIVVDLPDPLVAADRSVAHYVAMSRARSVLSLVHRMRA